MARPKSPVSKQTLFQSQEEIAAAHPVVEERWFVVDFFPPSKRCNEYDYGFDFVPASAVKASPYFDSYLEAQKWSDLCEPDEGATLEIRHQNLREFTSTKWCDW